MSEIVRVTLANSHQVGADVFGPKYRGTLIGTESTIILRGDGTILTATTLRKIAQIENLVSILPALIGNAHDIDILCKTGPE